MPVGIYKYAVIISASMRHSVSAIAVDLSPRPSFCRSVGLSVRKVYCGKTAHWIWMPFGVGSGVGREMRVLDGGGYRRREGRILGVNVGASHRKQWGL